MQVCLTPTLCEEREEKAEMKERREEGERDSLRSSPDSFSFTLAMALKRIVPSCGSSSSVSAQ